MPVAIVTGASRGFGRALAVDLARDNWSVVIDARDAALLEEAGKILSSHGCQFEAIAGDIASSEHRVALVDAARRLGGIDLLVNNASTLGPSPLPNLSQFPIQELRRVFEVNVLAPLALIQSALPLLRQAQGTVVSLSSDAAVEAYQGWGGYGASKSALDQLHNVLAVEEPELHIYQFDPGDMRTEMHQSAFPGEDISDRPVPEAVVPALRRLLESRIPSGRHRASDWLSS